MLRILQHFPRRYLCVKRVTNVARQTQVVGWVEPRETHRESGKLVGLAKLDPPYALLSFVRLAMALENPWSIRRFSPTIEVCLRVEVDPPPSTLNSHPLTLPWLLENEKRKSKPYSSSARNPAITTTLCVARRAAKSSSSRSSAPASASTRCTPKRRSRGNDE